MRAPLSGFFLAYSARIAIRPGISVSAMFSSLRPQAARAMSAITQSTGALTGVLTETLVFLVAGAAFLAVGMVSSFASGEWMGSALHSNTRTHNTHRTMPSSTGVSAVENLDAKPDFAGEGRSCSAPWQWRGILTARQCRAMRSHAAIILLFLC